MGIIRTYDSPTNPDFSHADPFMDPFIVRIVAQGVDSIEGHPSTLGFEMARPLLEKLHIVTNANLVVTPAGDHFGNHNGSPTGEMDAILIEEEGGGVIYSLSLPGMRIENLLKMKDDPDAIKALFDKNDLYTLANGDDVVSSRDGDDEVNVGGGNNVVHAGNGNDKVSAIGAASGNNQFFGENGNDRLDGWNGKDRLDGGNGDDLLFGWAGRDRLTGGSGDDRLTGGADADILTGRAGRDIFDFNTLDAGAGKQTRDTITDFERGMDKLELAQFRIDGVFGAKLDFIAAKDFSDSGQVRFEKADGGILVEVNYEGGADADFAIFLKGLDAIGKGDLTL